MTSISSMMKPLAPSRDLADDTKDAAFLDVSVDGIHANACFPDQQKQLSTIPPSSVAVPRSPLRNLSSGEITSFAVGTEDLQFIGYQAKVELNLRHRVTKREQAVEKSNDLSAFSLGRPAVHGQLAAVGNDDPEEQHYFLSLVNIETLISDGSKDSLICNISVSEQLSDLHWLNSSTLVAAAGKGNLKMFNYDDSRRQLNLVGDMLHASDSYIREMATDSAAPNNVVIGGFDCKLNFLDLNKPTNPYVQRLDLQQGISSVKWRPFNHNQYVSCTVDEGKFYLFDARTKITEAAYYMDTKKEDLFTHERYHDFNLLLGYGDGLYKHIDMRVANRVLHDVQDPFVSCIGAMEYNAESSAIVVSGFADFSVLGIKNGELTVRSHSQLDTGTRRANEFMNTAVWYDRSTILSADNAGMLGVFLQDFE